MDEIKKFSVVKSLEVTDDELALINRQTLRPLSSDDVFIFRVAACDDQVDREHERFTLRTLNDLADLFVGKTFVLDHAWVTSGQCARIYAAKVEQDGNVNRLVLRVYMLRNESTEPMIAGIEGGILREVSVGCAVESALCSICGTDRAVSTCNHIPGHEYDGKVCHVDLDKAIDAYECSFVAVPAQPKAGVIKQYGGEGGPQDGSDAGADNEELLLAQARQEQEEKRFGGIKS